MELKLEVSRLSKLQDKTITTNLSSFLDTAGVSTQRASFYNTKEEQEAATQAVHNSLFKLDRGIYALSAIFPDTTDYTRQLVLENILSTPWINSTPGIISEEQENKVLRYYANEMPITRLLRTFMHFREKRINNARTRKLILSTLLNPNTIEYWALKYRSKLKAVLQHAWGKGVASSISKIVDKPNFKITVFNQEERETLSKYVDKYVKDESRLIVYEALSFIFGNTSKKWTLKLFKEFEDAKKDLNLGRNLPLEVLQGLKAAYHKGSKINLIELTKNTSMTSTQKKVLQATAEKQGVSLEFNPKSFNATDLYIYALERGMTPEIKEELKKKATISAAGFPLKFNSIGIIVDTSLSMMGDKTNKNKPIATAMALRDTLIKTATKAEVFPKGKIGDLCYPTGPTSLSGQLIDAVEAGVEAVYIISDGYENAPAGRLNEVMLGLRKIGINIPIFHFNPVYASEVSATRTFSDLIPALPVSKTSSIWIPFFQLQLKDDPKEAIKLLATRAASLIKE